MALDESALFNKTPETRPGQFQCPRCRRTGDYRIRWMRHSKKRQLSGRGDAADRAKFEKMRDYLLRLDDDVDEGVQAVDPSEVAIEPVVQVVDDDRRLS